MTARRLHQVIASYDKAHATPSIPRPVSTLATGPDLNGEALAVEPNAKFCHFQRAALTGAALVIILYVFAMFSFRPCLPHALGTEHALASLPAVRALILTTYICWPNAHRVSAQHLDHCRVGSGQGHDDLLHREEEKMTDVLNGLDAQGANNTNPNDKLPDAEQTDEIQVPAGHMSVKDLKYDNRVRHAPRKEDWKPLAKAIKAGEKQFQGMSGFVEVGKVDGEHLILDGGKLFEAWKSLGETTVPVVIHEDMSVEDARKTWLLRNNNRKTDDLANVFVVGDHFKEGGDSKSASHVVGMQKSQALSLKAVAEAGDEVHNAIRGENKFSVSHAIKLLERKGTYAEIDVAHWIDRVIKEKLSITKMKEAIDAQYGVKPPVEPLEPEDKQADNAEGAGANGDKPAELEPSTPEQEDAARTRVYKKLEEVGEVKITYKGGTYDLRSFADTFPAEVDMLLIMLMPELEGLAEGQDETETELLDLKMEHGQLHAS